MLRKILSFLSLIQLKEKISWLIFFVKKNIDIIICQWDPYKASYAGFFKQIREKYNLSYSIITCLHRPPVVQFSNKVYCWEPTLRRMYFGFIVPIIKLSFFRRFIEQFYILKYRKLMNQVCCCSDYVVALTCGMVDEIKKMCGSTLWQKNKYFNKIRVIGNCIPEGNDVAISEKTKTILWVGNFFNVKRVDLLLKAWSVLQNDFVDWNLVLCGDGSKGGYAKKCSQSLGLRRVSFVGEVNPKSYYDKASILVVTSAYEAFSMVILEALDDCVVPVVFDSFPSARDLIVDNYNGLLVRAFDVDALVNTLSFLMKDDDKMVEMAERGPNSVKKWTESSIYLLWDKLFEEIKCNK